MGPFYQVKFVEFILDHPMKDSLVLPVSYFLGLNLSRNIQPSEKWAKKIATLRNSLFFLLTSESCHKNWKKIYAFLDTTLPERRITNALCKFHLFVNPKKAFMQLYPFFCRVTPTLLNHFRWKKYNSSNQETGNVPELGRKKTNQFVMHYLHIPDETKIPIHAFDERFIFLRAFEHHSIYSSNVSEFLLPVRFPGLNGFIVGGAGAITDFEF